MAKVVFGLTVMAWNAESLFWSDWNRLVLRKSVLDCLSCLGMEEVGFGLTGIAGNDKSRV
jgi:hypothetical protein